MQVGKETSIREEAFVRAGCEGVGDGQEQKMPSTCSCCKGTQKGKRRTRKRKFQASCFQTAGLLEWAGLWGWAPLPPYVNANSNQTRGTRRMALG